MIKPTAEITGAKDAIKALRKIDPELRKQFNREAKNIAQPIIDDAKRSYPEKVLSGMVRNWQQNGNPKFPYSAAAARKGVRFKVDTSRKAVSIIKIQQTNPAAVIIEYAGKGSANPLGASLDQIARASRFLWPAAERQLPKVQDEMRKVIDDVMRKVDEEVR